MRQSQAHYEQGIFVAEGVKVCTASPRKRLHRRVGPAPDKWLAEFEPVLRARPEQDIPVFVVTEKHVLEQLIGFSMFQGGCRRQPPGPPCPASLNAARDRSSWPPSRASPTRQISARSSATAPPSRSRP